MLAVAVQRGCAFDCRPLDALPGLPPLRGLPESWVSEAMRGKVDSELPRGPSLDTSPAPPKQMGTPPNFPMPSGKGAPGSYDDPEEWSCSGNALCCGGMTVLAGNCCVCPGF